mmetsp:Transcript_36857/g.77809  ORF Transcript_36857/g.77809 Transcript_36857/m.77809 type:complete len:320 (-) Transcript_36857:178-1137(-)
MHTAKAIMASSLMKINRIAKQGITHPFGDSRTVSQAFPNPIPSELSDPFLMCDYFESTESKGKAAHPDDFPVGWHPHRGMDIASYLRTGTGRHGDSLGNRETFSSPGMQWMSVGSGVEHAEGGANDVGTRVQGFQIWINVPAERKMDDPRYGTVPSKDLPLVKLEGDNGSNARVLAGNALGVRGPFETVQDVQMVDFRLEGSGSLLEFEVQKGLDTAMLYVYENGLKSVNSKNDIKEGSVILFDADSDERRKFILQKTTGIMLFAGKKLKEPIAWYGPIVMNTQEEIKKTRMELSFGQFPPKRVDWDYKRLSAFPSDEL